MRNHKAPALPLRPRRGIEALLISSAHFHIWTVLDPAEPEVLQTLSTSLTGRFVPPVTGRQKSGDPPHEQRLEPAGAPPPPAQQPDPLIWISEETETPDRISKDFKDSRMIPGRCAGGLHPNLAS